LLLIFSATVLPWFLKQTVIHWTSIGPNGGASIVTSIQGRSISLKVSTLFEVALEPAEIAVVTDHFGLPFCWKRADNCFVVGISG
jgi:hypothetical protein